MICDISHRYTHEAIEKMPHRLGGAHIACQGHDYCTIQLYTCINYSCTLYEYSSI